MSIPAMLQAIAMRLPATMDNAGASPSTDMSGGGYTGLLTPNDPFLEATAPPAPSGQYVRAPAPAPSGAPPLDLTLPPPGGLPAYTPPVGTGPGGTVQPSDYIDRLTAPFTTGVVAPTSSSSSGTGPGAMSPLVAAPASDTVGGLPTLTPGQQAQIDAQSMKAPASRTVGQNIGGKNTSKDLLMGLLPMLLLKLLGHTNNQDIMKYGMGYLQGKQSLTNQQNQQNQQDFQQSQNVALTKAAILQQNESKADTVRAGYAGLARQMAGGWEKLQPEQIPIYTEQANKWAKLAGMDPIYTVEDTTKLQHAATAMQSAPAAKMLMQAAMKSMGPNLPARQQLLGNNLMQIGLSMWPGAKDDPEIQAMANTSGIDLSPAALIKQAQDLTAQFGQGAFMSGKDQAVSDLDHSRTILNYIDSQFRGQLDAGKLGVLDARKTLLDSQKVWTDAKAKGQSITNDYLPQELQGKVSEMQASTNLKEKEADRAVAGAANLMQKTSTLASGRAQNASMARSIPSLIKSQTSAQQAADQAKAEASMWQNQLNGLKSPDAPSMIGGHSRDDVVRAWTIEFGKAQARAQSRQTQADAIGATVKSYQQQSQGATGGNPLQGPIGPQGAGKVTVPGLGDVTYKRG